MSVYDSYEYDDSDSDFYDDDDELFVVERVVGKRGRGVNADYLVKWADYDSSCNTWEPLSHLKGCEALIEDYECRVRVARECRRRLQAATANLPRGTVVIDRKSEYVVEKLVGKRINAENRLEYLVKWEGHDDESENMWVSLSGLRYCLHLVEKFETQSKEEFYATDVEDVKKVEEDEERCFQLGWKVERLIASAKIDNDIKFLIKWKDRNVEQLVSNQVLRKWIPQMVIKFYEDRVKWIDGEDY